MSRGDTSRCPRCARRSISARTPTRRAITGAMRRPSTARASITISGHARSCTSARHGERITRVMLAETRSQGRAVAAGDRHISRSGELQHRFRRATIRRLIDWLHERGVRLIGIDTPSIDLFDSKDLPSHQTFLQHDMAILEGLALTRRAGGLYELIALPLQAGGLRRQPGAGDSQIVAMTFSSTAIGVGRQFTSTVVRAGWHSAKCSAYRLLKVAKLSFMFVRKTVTSTMFAHAEPASSRIARMLRKTDRHWAAKSPGIASVPGSRGPMPERKSKLPTRRACGYAPTGLGAPFGSHFAAHADSVGYFTHTVFGSVKNLQRLVAAFAADARLLHAAERHAQVAQQPAVDPNRTALEMLGDAMRPRQVAGPQRRRKPIRRRVGPTDHVRLRLERCHGHDRAEDFFLIDAAIRRQARR